MRRAFFKSMFIVLLLFAFACQKEQLIPTQPEANSVHDLPAISANFMFDNSSKTQALDQLAKLVAYSMQDADFRNFVKKQALKQIDGDFDVIYKYSKSKTVDGKLTLEDYLEEKASAYFGEKVDINKLISEVKDFQISVPVHCDKWDTQNYVPLVTYIPESFDESTFTFVKAYDAQGNVYTLGLDKVPDVPVVVLGSCERMNYINKDKNVDPDDGGGTGGSGYPNDPIPHENLRGIEIKNLQKVETWAQGKPELRYIILTPGASPTEDNYIPKEVLPSWSDLKNKFNYITYLLFRWNESLGQFYTITWIEHDDGRSTTLTIGASGQVHDENGNTLTLSVSTTIDLTNKDDKFGTKVIYRDDPFGIVYSLNTYSGATLKWTRKLE